MAVGIMLLLIIIILNNDPAEIFKEQGGADVMEKAKRECGPEILSFWQLP